MTGLRVGILSPGEMGAAVGGVLKKSGLDVLTCLDGRGNLTRLRALEAGIREVGFYDDLVQEADLILSILVPSEALAVAERVARSLKRTKAKLAYVDCNAVSPATVRAIGRVVSDAGGEFLDAGIIGGPPRGPNSGTRFHCSGPNTAAFEALRDQGLDVRVVGLEIGQASGLKMVYAASTKGTTALWTELLVAARRLGLGEALARELEGSRIAADVMRGVPSMPRRSRRWVGEMEEIAATFAEVGLTPRMLEGAADLFRFVGATPLGDLTERDEAPVLDAMLDTLAMSSDDPAPLPAVQGRDGKPGVDTQHAADTSFGRSH